MAGVEWPSKARGHGEFDKVAVSLHPAESHHTHRGHQEPGTSMVLCGDDAAIIQFGNGPKSSVLYFFREPLGVEAVRRRSFSSVSFIQSCARVCLIHQPRCFQVSLRILDISQNRLTKLEGIAALPCLQTLNASKNFLADAASLEELGLCGSLCSLDISNNALEGEGVFEAIAATPKLVSFNLTGNPVMSTPHLRKQFIIRMPQLAYLDRPVFEAERLAAEAWGRGGREAEIEARTLYRDAAKAKAAEEQQQFRDWRAAKIEERRKKGFEVLELSGPVPTDGGDTEEKISGGAEVEEPSTDPSTEGGEQPQEVNVKKLAHKFWSAEATQQAQSEPSPNSFGDFDVASFRAPSYVPDTLDYDDIAQSKATSGAPPPPPPVIGETTLGPSSTLPTVPPPASTAETDFDSLD